MPNKTNEESNSNLNFSRCVWHGIQHHFMQVSRFSLLCVYSRHDKIVTILYVTATHMKQNIADSLKNFLRHATNTKGKLD